MRHRKQRGKLSRDAAHRKALFMNLCREVIDHERGQAPAGAFRVGVRDREHDHEVRRKIFDEVQVVKDRIGGTLLNRLILPGETN